MKEINNEVILTELKEQIDKLHEHRKHLLLINYRITLLKKIITIIKYLPIHKLSFSTLSNIPNLFDNCQSFHDEIENINNKYQLNDIENYNKKILIRKQNYNRLRDKYNESK